MTIRAVLMAAQNYAAMIEQFHTADNKHFEAQRALGCTTENRQYYLEEVQEAWETLERCLKEAREAGDLP